MLHKNLGLDDIHPIHTWEVATLAALAALVVTAEDRGKVAWILEDNKLYFLANEVAPTWAPLGASGEIGIPIGGTTGQVLAKASDDDYDVQWVDAGIVVDPPTGDDDMAESNGTFVPTVYDDETDGAQVEHGTQVGHWHRLGNRVFFSLHVSCTFAPEVAFGSFSIGNLPFDIAVSGDGTGNGPGIPVTLSDTYLRQDGVNIESIQARIKTPATDTLSGPVRIVLAKLTTDGPGDVYVTNMGGETFLTRISGSYMTTPVVP